MKIMLVDRCMAIDQAQASRSYTISQCHVPAWIAPEMATGDINKIATTAEDVYALGILAYELVHGK